MPAITIDLDQEQIDRAQSIADKLSKVYGTRVSRASVVRRAIMAYEPHDLRKNNDDTRSSITSKRSTKRTA